MNNDYRLSEELRQMLICRILAHRDILRRRAILVAFGVEADINPWDEFDDFVEDGPFQT
jgi:hypothetical protein